MPLACIDGPLELDVDMTKSPFRRYNKFASDVEAVVAFD
jgi:hypothetical protein